MFLGQIFYSQLILEILLILFFRLQQQTNSLHLFDTADETAQLVALSSSCSFKLSAVWLVTRQCVL